MEDPLSGLVGGSDFEKPKHLTVVFGRCVDDFHRHADHLRDIYEFDLWRGGCAVHVRLFSHHWVEPVA
jgi:hypothetical protein